MPAPTAAGQTPPVNLSTTHGNSIESPTGVFVWPALPSASGPILGQLIEPNFNANTATAFPTAGYDERDYLIVGTAGTIGASTLAVGEQWYKSGATFTKAPSEASTSKTYTTYAQLKLETTTAGKRYYVEGRTAVGDGGSGWFEDIGAGTKDDNGYHLAAAGGRQLQRVGKVTPAHFGATMVATEAAARAGTDQAAAVQPWLDAYFNELADIDFPGGNIIRVDSELLFRPRTEDKSLNGVFWAPKQRSPIVRIRDDRGAAVQREGRPTVRVRVMRDRGVAGNDPAHTGYDYATTFDDSSGTAGSSVNASGERVHVTAFNENDIGVIVDGCRSMRVRYEARGCAIGAAVDPVSDFCSWLDVVPEGVSYNKIVGMIRTRNAATGWVNEITFGEDRLNINSGGLATNTRSSYCYMSVANPAEPTATQYTPTGLKFLGSYENADHATAPESVFVAIERGGGAKIYGRADGPQYKQLRVLDHLSNSKYTFFVEKYHHNTTVSGGGYRVLSGGDWKLELDGRKSITSMLVDARDLRNLLVPNDATTNRVKGPYLAFQLTQNQPQLSAPVSNSLIVDDTTIDNYNPAFTGGIGAMIELGNDQFGGCVQVNVSKNDTPTISNGVITVICYNAAGTVLTPTATRWLVRDTTDAATLLSNYSISHGTTSRRPFNIRDDFSYRLRFDPEVARAFIAVSADRLHGFTLEAVDMPGAKPIELGPEGYNADQLPSHGHFLRPVDITHTDPNNPVAGWQLKAPAFPCYGGNRAVIGMTLATGQTIRNVATRQAWRVTTAGGTLPALPTGTGPNFGPDANGNSFTLLGNAAEFVTTNVPIADDPNTVEGAEAVRVTGNNGSYPIGFYFRDENNQYGQA